jgi:hypothetical protein
MRVFLRIVQFAALAVLFLFAPEARAWDLVNWQGPHRHTFASAFDPSRRALLVFGGSDGRVFRNETYVFDLTMGTWSQLTPEGAPPPRRLVEGIYDPVGDRFVVFGGVDDDGFYNDLWSLSLSDPSHWTQLRPTGPKPSPRAGHTVIYDPLGHRMILFGGFDPKAPGDRRNDVWTLSLAGRPAWRRVHTSGTPPAPCSSHSAVYDSTRARMLVFGGASWQEFGAEVWALSLTGVPTWTQIVPENAAPPAREEHASIYDSARDRLIIFWGHPSIEVDDIWAFSLTGAPVWNQLASSPDGAPHQPFDWGHGAFYDPPSDSLYTYGGYFSRYQVWVLQLWAIEP